MPPSKTDEELANKFANHFLDKIEKKTDQNSPPLSHTLLRHITLQQYIDSPSLLKTNYTR